MEILLGWIGVVFVSRIKYLWTTVSVWISLKRIVGLTLHPSVPVPGDLAVSGAHLCQWGYPQADAGGGEKVHKGGICYCCAISAHKIFACIVLFMKNSKVKVYKGKYH